MEHGVAITCESCHGDARLAYAPTVAGHGLRRQRRPSLAVDGAGNPLRHVDPRRRDGNYYLTSRLTGRVATTSRRRATRSSTAARINPFDGEPVYSAKASYAMGRADGDPDDRYRPASRRAARRTGFSHGDNMSCVACHASWTNSCIGCHLEGEYDTGNNFSNITGERIVFEQDNADFVYQSTGALPARRRHEGQRGRTDRGRTRRRSSSGYEDNNNESLSRSSRSRTATAAATTRPRPRRTPR